MVKVLFVQKNPKYSKGIVFFQDITLDWKKCFLGLVSGCKYLVSGIFANKICPFSKNCFAKQGIGIFQKKNKSRYQILDT
jgi:hypothetical protein